MLVGTRALLAAASLVLVMTRPAWAEDGTLSCVEKGPDGACRLHGASVIALLSNPGQFHGKRVSIAGFISIEFESNGLCLHREDALHALLKNGLWLDTPPQWLSATRCKNQSYVLLQGTFNARRGGHMDLWSGAIESITSCTPLE
jgi:hypothetical protein